MSTLSVVCGVNARRDQKFSITVSAFPGGEINLRLPDKFLAIQDKVISLEVRVRISDSAGFMALAMLTDALHNSKLSHKVIADMVLCIGYLPYGRQDRICNEGEAYASARFCQMLSNLRYKKIHTLDPHSPISIRYLKNKGVVNTQADMVVRIPGLFKHSPKGRNRKITLVAPDAGAAKKTLRVAQVTGCLDIIQGHKVRDLLTGELSGFTYEGNVKGKTLLIVDDICDGGGTFIGLTKELLKGGAKSVSLYVSHGIFSKGLDVLFDGGIDHIYTTDTIYNELKHPKLTKLKWY